MHRAQKLAALAAGLLCLAMGVHDACRQPGAAERRLMFAAVLRPLAALPLPAGTVVALVVPPAIVAGGGEGRPVFYEAVWRRPDLLWSSAPEVDRVETCRYAVVVGPFPAAAPWRQIWRSGRLTLLERPPS
ncbi:MAG: hypothetical protein EPN53_12090 [Acidobacteria bacterium]|nr:MAG: hypothetical protein EPN53_12090 [Acidobacteriota bacterium]